MNDRRLIFPVVLVGLLLMHGRPAAIAPVPAAPRVRAADIRPISAPAAALTPSVADAGWWAAAQDDIRRSEYRVTWQAQTSLADIPAAYQAPNRSHNLRTYFTSEGIRIVPRTLTPNPSPSQGEGQKGEGWSLTFHLAAFGPAEALQPVGDPVEMTATENRFEYRYQGSGSRGQDAGVSEQYVNDEQGLQQSFILAAPPAGADGRAPLQIALDIAGDLTPRLTADGAALEFTAADGAGVLRYGDLRATDAAGRALPVSLNLVPADAGTRTTQYAFRLVIADSAATYPITVDAVITGLSPTANWMAESNQTEANLGYSVTTAGDVNGDGYADVIVGAWLYDRGETNEGRVFAFYGSATGLDLTAAWTAEGNQSDARFGFAVSTAGDVNDDGYADVIVGALYYDNGESNEGRAYVYHGSATGLNSMPTWIAESNQAEAFFGISVAAAGDVNGDSYADVIVGAVHFDHGEGDEGLVFVYHGSASGLGAVPAWTAESNQTSAEFGHSVSTAGDVNGDGYADVMVGAPTYGRAYVYHGSAAGLGATPAWTGESGQAGGAFGSSVSTAGDVNGDGYSDVIVGAHQYDNGEQDEGRVYVYYGSAAGLNATVAWMTEGDQGGARYGFSVSTAGDVNGDGYADVLVGAYRYDNGQTDEGQACVFYGSASGLSSTAMWTAESNQTNAGFGYSVGTAGDVNGDGYSDVIVGVPWYDNPQGDEGAAFVYHGSPDGLSATANWTAEGNQDGAQFGLSAATAGDVNGDGYADVIIGAPYYHAGSGYGGAFVYFGSASGLGATPAWTASSSQGGGFGYSVGAAGDVNGDGYGDIIIGAPGSWAFVYHGSASGPSMLPDWTAQGDGIDPQFGTSVGTAGDVNGDGFADVIVGAHFYDEHKGRAYVYLGSSQGLSAVPGWTATGIENNARFGASVGTAGDVNGDGYSDVIVGTYYYTCDVKCYALTV